MDEDNISNYQAIFGPIEIDIDILKEPSEGIIRTIPSLNYLRSNIKEKGLINPLDIVWDLKENLDKLIIERGNQRIYILREMGWKKVPCYLKIRFYKSNLYMAEIFKTLFPFIKENYGTDYHFLMEQKPTSYKGKTY